VLILDADHFWELLRGSVPGMKLSAGLTAQGMSPITTIVTLEEQSRGWLSRINQADTDHDLTMDLRIASIALSQNGTLLTRNQRDFDRIPGLITQNWL
jgi:predicted nucleic acid-binding protein